MKNLFRPSGLALVLSLIMFAACQGGVYVPLEVSPSEIVLCVGQQQQITTNTQATFIPEEIFFADVNKTGLVTANKVGITNITVATRHEEIVIPVVVVPQFTLIPELDLYIGKSKTEAIYDFGIKYTQSPGGVLWYNNYNAYCSFALSVTNNIVESCLAIVPNEHATMLTSFLEERFEYLGRENEFFYFTNYEQDLDIVMSTYDDYSWYVSFTLLNPTQY